MPDHLQAVATLRGRIGALAHSVSTDNGVVADGDDLERRLSHDPDLRLRVDEAMQELANLTMEAALERETFRGRRFEQMEATLTHLEMRASLRGPDDHRGAIVTISPGASDDESRAWAGMLLQMYTKWAERHQVYMRIRHLEAVDTVRVTAATLEIVGSTAYGLLSGEAGAHRLARISPYDPGGRRHTSFATVRVWPNIGIDGDLSLPPGEVAITPTAEPGGGMRAGTIERGVSLTHTLTGIVAAANQERDQFRNRRAAERILLAALYARARGTPKTSPTREEGAFGPMVPKADGALIRSYVLYPYSQATDHRTGFSIRGAEAVLDGELDHLIRARLVHEGVLVTPDEIDPKQAVQGPLR